MTDASFLSGGGEVGTLLRSKDWANTPLGSPQGWPQPLRTAIRLMLNSRHPMYIFWGTDSLCFYNDAYRPSVGPERHPSSLGRPMREVWEEILDVIEPQIRQVMEGRGATWHEDQLVPITRNGQREDVYWTYSYGPIDDELAPSGIGGVLVVCSETTAAVRAQQRQAFQIDVADALRGLSDPEVIMDVAAKRLGAFLGVDQANYYTIDGDLFIVEREWRTERSAGLVGRHRLADYDSASVARLRRGKVLCFADVAGIDNGDRFRAVGMSAVVSVPMHRADRWVSGFHVHQASPRPWSDADVALIRDVAERVWAEIERVRALEALRQLNRKLEKRVAKRTRDRNRLWQLSMDIMLAARFDSVVEAVNPACSTTLGWSEAELVGRELFSIIHPEDLDRSRAAAQSLAEGSAVKRIDTRMRHRDGSYRWITWSAVPGDGLINAVGRDVTADYERDAALAATQEALRRSQRLEAMGQLTGGVAHDFNNLLTPVLGSLDLLHRKCVGTERERRMINGALQSAERAKDLVHRLLAFGRRQSLQPSAIDAATIVAGMSELIDRTSGPKVVVEIAIAPDLPAAIADASQLEMALLNLAVNARDAMPEGGTLFFAAEAEQIGDGHRSGLASGLYVRIAVTDTGLGMDEVTRQRAIEPFFSTKGIGKGTGLGLSMVHGLMSQLRGALELISDPGHGTTVMLWLPASDVKAQPNDTKLRIHDAGQGHGTILLVDDEAVVRASVSDMLTEMGFRVVEASSAERALTWLDGQETIDCLITDYLMPGMNGSQLAQAIRSQRPACPVLVITGFANADGVSPDLPRLTKPFRSTDLYACLARFGLMTERTTSADRPTFAHGTAD